MKRTMVIAGQNETIRKSIGQTVELCTLGLINCVAVVIRGKDGQASLTHVDSHTDLNFITYEIKALDVKDLTLDIIQDKDNISDLALKVCQWLDQKSLVTINSKGCQNTSLNATFSAENSCVRQTKNQAVLVRSSQKNMRLLVPKVKDIEEHFISSKLSKDNSLANYEIGHGGAHKDFQLRLYEHQLACYLEPSTHRKPDVVYDADNGWSNSFVEPSAISKERLMQLQILDNKGCNPMEIKRMMESFYQRSILGLTSIPLFSIHDQRNIERGYQTIKRYWAYKQKMMPEYTTDTPRLSAQSASS